MFLSYHGYKTQCSHCSALFNLQAYPLSGFFVPDSLSVPIIPCSLSCSKYFEENNVHAFLIQQIKDFERCVEEVEKFLPYINNWATCDMMSPKIFKKHKEQLLVSVRRWISSDETYTVRYGIGMLMQHFLDEDFREEYLALAAGIRSQEYYVNMMIAWYFATALAKQYEKALPYIEEKRLDDWTHNKAIQKSCESYRITPEQKAYLRTLKVKKARSQKIIQRNSYEQDNRD